MVWGKYVQDWTTAAGLGQPSPPPGVVPDWRLGQQKKGSHMHGGGAKANLPWALEKTAPPQSAQAVSAQPAINADQALAILAALGVEKPFSLAFPSEPKGPTRPHRGRPVWKRRGSFTSINIAARFWAIPAMRNMARRRRQSSGALPCTKGRNMARSIAMSCSLDASELSCSRFPPR
jgi:hypothetical protein